MKSRFLRACFFLSLVLCWEWIVRRWDVPRYLVPRPSQVLEDLWSDRSLLGEHLLFTLQEWSIGLILSVALGLGIALLCFWWKAFRFLFEPFLVISQSTPYLVFAPLLLLWLGLGILPKVVLIILTCSFPIALSVTEGLIRAKEEYGLIVRMLRMNALSALFHVYFPAALGDFFSALKISVSYAFVSAVLAELIGSEAGLGVFITRAQSAYQTSRVLGAVVIVVCISLVSTAIVDMLRKKVIFWNVVKR
jgi:putative hydroxymethylpyrimidine transport system permease protein